MNEKVFEINVTIYVSGAIAEDALDHLAGELDWICGADNRVLTVSYPDANDIKEEGDEV